MAEGRSTSLDVSLIRATVLWMQVSQAISAALRVGFFFPIIAISVFFPVSMNQCAVPANLIAERIAQGSRSVSATMVTCLENA